MKVLLIEDDRELNNIVKDGLIALGYEVEQAYDGEDGFYKLCEGGCDIAVVDRMIPIMSGTELVKKARKMNNHIPVIMATALGDIDDKIAGLDSGADDYIVKPFDVRELAARIRAQSRRLNVEDNSVMKFGDLMLIRDELRLIGPLGEQTVTPTEAELIGSLIMNSGKVMMRNQLFARVWGTDSDLLDGSLDIYIHYARSHIGKVSNTVSIKTIRGKGYKLQSVNE